MTEPTKIVRLAAENVKRIRAVEIEPDGNVVVISGRNGQGKTSVLDSIWFALGGAKAEKETPRPIRDGEDHARVSLDMGDYTVTRTWDEAGSRVVVMAKDGTRYASPQKFLDQRLGDLSFDPLAFTRKSAKDQLADLLKLVELPFDPLELEVERDMIYGRRTNVGRDLKSVHGQLDAVVDAPDGDDEAEVSIADLLAEATAADEAARARERAVDRRDQAVAHLAHMQDEFDELKRRLAALSGQIAAKKNEVDDLTQAVTELPVDDDRAVLRQRLADAEDVNNAIRERNRQREAKRSLALQVVELEQKVVELTDEISAIDNRKAIVLAAATMPVEGLAFDKEGVTYRGVPFAQCSAAEQLRISLGMAMAMNPTIGVIRITDGSLLDKTNMELIREMAEARQMQVWVERVADEHGIGFVIEDGALA